MIDNSALIITILGLVAGWSIHLATLVWWLRGQFQSVRDVLAAHELQDERRFTALETIVKHHR